MKVEKRDHFTIIINTSTSATDPVSAAMLEFMAGKGKR